MQTEGARRRYPATEAEETNNRLRDTRPSRDRDEHDEVITSFGVRCRGWMTTSAHSRPHQARVGWWSRSEQDERRGERGEGANGTEEGWRMEYVSRYPLGIPTHQSGTREEYEPSNRRTNKPGACWSDRLKRGTRIQPDHPAYLAIRGRLRQRIVGGVDRDT